MANSEWASLAMPAGFHQIDSLPSSATKAVPMPVARAPIGATRSRAPLFACASPVRGMSGSAASAPQPKQRRAIQERGGISERSDRRRLVEQHDRDVVANRI